MCCSSPRHSSSILSRSRRLLYAYRADFQSIHAHRHDEAESAPEESAPIQLASKKKRGQKRKAEADADPNLIPGLGSESLQLLTIERKKKANKKQRAAAKRRKKEALLGSEPGQPTGHQEEEADQEDGDDDMLDVDADAVVVDGDVGDLPEIDMDASDLDEDSMPTSFEAEEDATFLAPPIQSKITKKEQARLDQAIAQAAQAKKDKEKKGAAGQKRIVPIQVREEVEEAEEAETFRQQKNKKQKTAPTASAAAVVAAPVAAPVPAAVVKSAKASKSSSPSSGSAAAAAATAAAPSSPSQPTTPPKQKRAAVPTTAATTPPTHVTLVGFSTPQAKVAASKAEVVGGTQAKAAQSVAPPSSSKKAVRIVLSNNQVKQFKKFSRDSITTQTTALLAKPSPKSAIKTSSMEFFLNHNKNGRELKARQTGLERELADAGQKPTSPSRAKAKDFFFQ